MTVKYFYKGQEVTLVPGQQYSSHWNVYYNMPTENGGSKQIIVTAVVGENLEIVDDSQSSTKEKTTSLSLNLAEALNINLAGYAAIRKAFPGIGRVAPKAITQNRPDNGYENFNHFVELNKSLNLNWEELKGKIIFE